MIRYSDIQKQTKIIKNELNRGLEKVFHSGAFIRGKYSKKFEDKFSKKIGIKYCLGVGNGTDALEIAIESLNLPKNSEIIVPANSFIASAEAPYRLGLKLVFCDCDKLNYTIDTSRIESLINKNTRAIIAVHLYGHPCNMSKLISLKKKYKLKIIEDCAQSHFAKYKNKFTGTLGDIGCFSFFPGKILGAYGDAGCVTTNNKNLFLKMKKISNHGGLKKYAHDLVGRNSRMDEIQALVLLHKLNYIDRWLRHRIRLAGLYTKLFEKNDGIEVVLTSKDCLNTYCYFVIRSKNIKKIKEVLIKNEIEFIIHYPKSIPNTNAFKKLNQSNTKRFAWTYGREILSLPLGIHLTEKSIIKITNIINQVA